MRQWILQAAGCVAYSLMIAGLLALWGLPTAVAAPGDTTATDGLRAYQSVSVQAGATTNVNRTRLHDDWQPGVGAEAVVAVPFYAGHLEAVAAYHRYQPRPTADVPAFQAILLQLGWGLEQPLTSRIAAHAGVRVGNYRMTFDVNGDLERAEITENELATALKGQVVFRVADRWSLVAATSYQRTFTRIRMDFVYTTVGVRYTFDSPSWLQTFLR
ncbi:MAG: hypothetical protein GVY12_04695 [Bacteroidetes bacterium]|nr:hypothetical protein [Bacteroidota bacterium]